METGSELFTWQDSGPGGGVLPYMGHIGMCAVKGMVFKQFTLA